jgi:hypothetical protein
MHFKYHFGGIWGADTPPTPVSRSRREHRGKKQFRQASAPAEETLWVLFSMLFAFDFAKNHQIFLSHNELLRVWGLLCKSLHVNQRTIMFWFVLFFVVLFI